MTVTIGRRELLAALGARAAGGDASLWISQSHVAGVKDRAPG